MQDLTGWNPGRLHKVSATYPYLHDCLPSPMYCWVAAIALLCVPGNMYYWVVAVGPMYLVVAIGCVPGPGIEGTAKNWLECGQITRDTYSPA